VFGDRAGLYLRLNRGIWLCGRCWKHLGMPDPYPERATPEQVHAAHLAIVEAMYRRGGADRHLVRKGRT
jgi:hypothetical protein